MSHAKAQRVRFIEQFLKIQDKERNIVPMVLNPVQKYFALHKTNRNVILKARQEGISSYCLADMFAEAITVPNTTCVVVSHEQHATERLLAKVHFFYDTFPDPKPIMGHGSASEISFPKLHSTIYIGTARSMTFGRGDTISHAHLSELAFYEDGERILNAVSDAVPLTSGELTIECTPNGEGNSFYDVWTKARTKRNGYTPFFFPWWLNNEYSLPLGSPFALEEDRGALIPLPEEEYLVETYGITEEQLRWRRRMLADKGGLFFQEYPEDEVSCFITAGEPVFNTERVNELAKLCYEGWYDADGVQIWRQPEAGARYVIGADCSEGVHSYSAASVLTENYEVIATYNKRVPPYEFAGVLDRLGRFYNNAQLAVERNAQGYDVLARLMEYPNIYLHRDFTTGIISNKRGWWTSEATKAHLFSTFKNLLPVFTTFDVNLVRQIRGYRYISYTPTAQTYDDMLMATMIACAVMQIEGTSRGFVGTTEGWE